MNEPLPPHIRPVPGQESPFKGRTGWRRIWHALHYSLAGLKAAYRCEDAFRQEVRLALVLVPAACFLPVSGLEQALLVATVLAVLVVELLNSAIEAAVDLVSLDRHHLAERAKDIGSAAVLVALLNALIVWCCILRDLL